MTLPRYPKYKDSGIEWLGPVPAHWECVRNKTVFYEIDERSDDAQGELLTVSHITGVTRRADKDVNMFLAETLEGYKRCAVGDLVINTMWAWMGALGCSPLDGLVSPSYNVYRPRDHSRLLPAYYDYLCRLPAHAVAMKARSTGVWESRLRLYPDAFLDMRMPLPPHDEQAAVAAFLDHETAKIDALVAEQERLIELLGEKRHAIISHAVTRGLNADAPMKDSGFEWVGHVPAHWVEVPLKALLTLKHGYAFDGEAFSDSGEYVLMTPGNFHERGGFRVKANEKFYVGPDIREEFVLKKGQLLVAMTEQAPGLLGSALFVPGDLTYLHNQRLGLAQDIRRERVSDLFLFYVFNSSRVRAEISVSSTGAKVKHTSPGRILSVRTFLPPLSEQEQICRFLEATTARLDDLELATHRVVELLQERRAALISAVVTGQIDVRDAATRSAA